MDDKLLYRVTYWGLGKISLGRIDQLQREIFVIHDVCNVLCMQYTCFIFCLCSTNKFLQVMVVEIFP